MPGTPSDSYVATDTTDPYIYGSDPTTADTTTGTPSGTSVWDELIGAGGQIGVALVQGLTGTAPATNNYYTDPNAATTKSNTWIWWAAGGVVVLGLIILLVVKRRK